MTDKRKLRDLVPRNSEFLASEDIKDTQPTVTIESIKRQMCTLDNGRKEEHAVCYFKGAEKGLILNVTNRRTLESLFGPYDVDCIGKHVRLVVVKTKMMGKACDGIRIEPPESTNLKDM